MRLAVVSTQYLLHCSKLYCDVTIMPVESSKSCGINVLQIYNKAGSVYCRPGGTNTDLSKSFQGLTLAPIQFSFHFYCTLYSLLQLKLLPHFSSIRHLCNEPICITHCLFRPTVHQGYNNDRKKANHVSDVEFEEPSQLSSA